MSSGVAASLRRIFLANKQQGLVIVSTCSIPQNHRTFSMQYKDTEKAAHPFDYVNKNYNYFRHYYLGGHYTLANIHDNTLFFHVESNFGVPRSDFVKRLADHIGFLSVPKPDLDRMHFVDETGTVNTREFHNDYCLPRDHMPSPAEWHLNPNAHASVRLLRPLLQTMSYQLRMGLSHMFSTGQGIVMDRSYWSYYAILNILRDFGYVSQDSYDFLLEYKVSIDYSLKMPRLIIFIDKDPHAIWEDIQKNGKDYQKGSKVYSLELLQAMDRMYKEEWLPRMSTYCHILQYNENEIKTLDDVVFDIEQLNFDDTNKFPDWRLTVDVELERFRAQLQDEHFWTRMFNVNRLLHLSEWWTEPNAQKTQLGLMKYDPRYYWTTNNWDIKPFFQRYQSWTRLPFY
ncbi:unnamed protein product [Adineta steineri]|uniref:NADH dehydrogenase [ubiquinone] 1 alpha subcomplex subunit 10, mitochondrial n=1 Tax=Adineta steineri TaxID=433720 RepID=A0A814VBA8_9BILA|nr:unnamed protein product [Adineta steineri]CAF1497658.1 unnamed protein product [Adineta steineri]